MSGPTDSTPTEEPAKNTLYCGFCGKSQHEVKMLISGPHTFICDECVQVCTEILKDHEILQTTPGQDIASLVKEVREGHTALTRILTTQVLEPLTSSLLALERTIDDAQKGIKSAKSPQT